MQRPRDPQRLGPFGTLGAWLHVWTPPRDAVVPPVPWRRVAIGGALAAVILGVAAALAVPAIQRSKDDAARREARGQAAFIAARRRALVADQAAQSARAAPAPTRPARVALLKRVEASVAADARARVREGRLKGAIKRASCSATADSSPGGVTPEQDLRRTRGSYDCTAVVDDIAGSASNGAGAVGYPFRAVVDFTSGRYAWCKTNPPPGERVVPDPRLVVELPAACRG
jgi:type II secretory pathway pseudopilin PulG